MDEKREAKLTGVVLPSVDLVALRRGNKAIVVLLAALEVAPLIVVPLVDTFAGVGGVAASLGRCLRTGNVVVCRLVAAAAVGLATLAMVRLRNVPGEAGGDPNSGDSII